MWAVVAVLRGGDLLIRNPQRVVSSASAARLVKSNAAGEGDCQ